MNNRGKIFFIAITSIFLIFYCVHFFNVEKENQKLIDEIPKEVVELSNKSIYLLENKNFEELMPLFLEVREEYKETHKGILNKISNSIEESGKIKNKKIIGVETWEIGTSSKKNIKTVLTLSQFECENKYFLYQTRATNENNNTYKLIDILFFPSDMSLEEKNIFSLTNRTTQSYIFVCFGIFSLLMSFYTAAIAFSRKEKLYICWMIISLIGAWSFSLNWTTGTMVINPFSLGFKNFSISFSSIYNPITFTLRIPLGASLYWLNILLNKPKEVFDEVNDVNESRNDI